MSVNETGSVFADDDAGPTSPNKVTRLPWKVLIADDEEEVHHVTRLVLGSFSFAERPLLLLHAYSAQEAEQLLQQHPDTAVALLDVVMEREHAGLELVQRIREVFELHLIRLVLRTGQPGQAPEHRVVAAYDINDYKEKTELTAQKLKTLMYASLRSYRDLLIIEGNKTGVERVLQATTTIFEERSLHNFASAVLAQLTQLLLLNQDAVFCRIEQCFAASLENGVYRIRAGSGVFESQVSRRVDDLNDRDINERLNHARQQKRSTFNNDYYVIYFASSNGAEYLLYVHDTRHLTEFDRELIVLFCSNVAIAFENLHLSNELEQSQKEMIYLLGEAIESRSNETGNHVRRVANITYYIALKAGVSPDIAEQFKTASPMHDVGKIAIADAILNKPGKHDQQEQVVMRSHARLGYDMMSKSARKIFQIAATTAHEHHENWDGSGYPRGLKGDEIALVGRITAVSDVFDALLSARCYKQPWSRSQVERFFKEERGRKFDPVLADIVLNNIDELMQIRDLFPD